MSSRGGSGFGRGPVPGQAAQRPPGGGFGPRTARLRLSSTPPAPGARYEWALDALRLLIGRADPPATLPEIDLGPHDSATPPSVSRRHAELYWHDGRLMLVDLGSTNGTAVNGAPLATPGPRQPGEPRELRPGDRLRCGTVECEVFQA